MFPQKNKLKLKKDFDKVFKTGHSYYGQFVGIKIVKNNLNFNRFAILISSKVDKKAVVRNKIRRELIKLLKEKENNFQNYIDCVIIVLSEIKKANKQEVEKDLNDTFLFLKII